MKTTRQINKEVSIEVDTDDDMPIIISTGGAFINVNLDELEQVYLFAKEQLLSKQHEKV